MGRVIHFELPADDPERAAEFYRRVFSWDVKKWEGQQDYWLVSTGGDELPGINGGISRRHDAAAHTVNTIAVEDLDATLEAVTGAGGRVVTERHLVEGVGTLAYCIDSEGNSFGVLLQEERTTDG
jgi:predicted enzyme related to lactoylglutathione lyase